MAQGETLVTLTRKMLNSDFPNERRLAIDALLKATGVSELSPLIMQWGSVPPLIRAAVAAGLYRAGYQVGILHSDDSGIATMHYFQWVNSSRIYPARSSRGCHNYD